MFLCTPFFIIFLQQNVTAGFQQTPPIHIQEVPVPQLPSPMPAAAAMDFSGYKTCAVLPAVKAQALQDTKFHAAATIPEKNNSKNPHIHHTGSKNTPPVK